QPEAQNSSSAEGQTGEYKEAELRERYDARLAIRDQINKEEAAATKIQSAFRDHNARKEAKYEQGAEKLRNVDTSLFDAPPSTRSTATPMGDEVQATPTQEIVAQQQPAAQTPNWLRDAIADRRKNSSTKDRLPTIAEETPQDLEEEHDP